MSQPLQFTQGDQQFPTGLQQGGEAAIPCGPEIELHRRDVLYRAGSWWVICSCGFLSCGFLSEGMAEASDCGVELLLACSAERRRRLIEGQR